MEISRLEQETLLKWRRRLEEQMERYEDYFLLYFRRGMILSGFAPFLLGFHVYLWMNAFSGPAIASVIQFLLGVLLLVPWVLVPVLFLFAGSREHKGIRIYFRGWLVLMAGAEVFWFWIL